MNYTQLVDNIQAWTENDATEFTTKIPVIINLAELRIYREADLTIARKEETLPTPVVGSSTLAAPTDLVLPRWIRIVNGDYLIQKDESFIREYITSSSTTGTPKYYATSSAGTNFVFAPSFDSVSTQLRIGYTYRPTQLSASNATTWLSLNAYDVLLFACMIEASNFMKMEAQDLASWKAHYADALAGLKNEEERRRRQDDYRQGEIR